MESLTALLDTLLIRLAWTSAQAVLLIGTVWLIGRLLPQLPSALRCTLWWLVGLQLLLGLCWSSPLQLRVLAPAVPIATVAQDHAVLPATAITGALPVLHVASIPVQSLPTAWYAQWRLILISLWLAAVLVQLLIAGRHWRDARRMLRDSQSLTDDSLRAVCAEQVRKLGLRRQPQLRVSTAIRSPQVTGLWRTTVLLPADQHLTLTESSMALAHELAHLRRGDLWLGWIPAVAQRLFFFHPLVAWAVREYALSREAACDAQVLQQTGTMPQAYGQLLLRLGVSHPMHAGLAGASPTFQNLKRRLTMLQHFDPVSRRHLRGWLLVALVAVAGVLPYRVTAASSKHDSAALPGANASALTPLAPLPPAPPMNAPAPPAPPAPLPPMAPPPPPPPPPPPRDTSFSARHVDIDTTNHAQNGFALIDGDSTVTINGSNADLDVVRKLHATNKSMLWFRRGDQAYLIRDKSMLERASRIYAPVTTLARQQGELAGQQGAVAGRQAGLAAQDAAFAQRQAELAGRQAEMAARVATREAAGSDEHARENEQEAQRREMDAAQAELDKRHAELEARQATQQRALETQQAGFEKRQQALEGQQQQAQQRAELAMNQLLDEALAKGLAQKTSLR
jgi:beta-lactamase regulating signal transducer with metallopeptidase domain